MTTKPGQQSAHAEPPQDRFATLSFEREIAVPLSALWQVWLSPAARAVWASPSPSVTVEFLEADSRLGGREVSLCKVAGQPDIRCECGWLELQPTRRSVNYEVVSSSGVTQSAALVTADFQAADERSRLTVTVQLSSLAEDKRMQAGENVSKLANEAGVSRQRLYEWRDHLRLYGDLSSRRRGRPPRVVSIVDGAAPLQTAMIAPSPQEQSLTKARRRVRELEQKIGQQQLDIDFFRESDGSRRCHKPCPQEASHRAAIRSATFPPPEKLSYAPSWLLVYGPESVSGPECHATNSLLYYLYENIRLFGSVTAMSSLINISG